ncbi:MAG TPA: NUDIX hydrolase [Puia sp.]|jgi:ADP-ribose pyrophosphatase YjhB (NUDIX family)
MSNHQNPWKILDQRPVYENPWIQVTEFQVLNPSGGNGIYGKVHFKNLAVGVVPLDADLNIYLVGQYRFVLNEYSWEIPEGGGTAQEDPLAAAKRELMEETGLVAREWSRLLTLHLSNSVSDELAVIYLARGLEQHNSMPEETESLVVKKIPITEAVSMLESGAITDAMSVASIQQVQLRLLQGRLK